MQEPKWENIAEYCYQRADTLFGDAEIVIEDDRFDDKRTLDLAYTYQHIAEEINRMIKSRAYLGDPA